MACEIHPSAVIEPGAELGEDIVIGPFTVIGRDVKVGDRTTIGSHSVVKGPTVIGAENRISDFASIGGAPQDIGYRGEPTTLVMGCRNVVREFVTLQRGTMKGHQTTVIGSGNYFMAYSHVAHDCVIGDECIFANSVALAGHVEMGDRVILGGLVGVHQFVRIGSYAILGGGSMVGSDVPPYCIGQGDRCRLRGINLIGLQRAGFSAEEIAQIKKVYRLLFSTTGRLKEKMESLPSELSAAPRIKPMLDFLAVTQRGICGPAKNLAL